MRHIPACMGSVSAFTFLLWNNVPAFFALGGMTFAYVLVVAELEASREEVKRQGELLSWYVRERHPDAYLAAKAKKRASGHLRRVK